MEKKTEKDITVRPSELYEKAIRSKRPEKYKKIDDGLIWTCAIKLKKVDFFADFGKKKLIKLSRGSKKQIVFKHFLIKLSRRFYTNF